MRQRACEISHTLTEVWSYMQGLQFEYGDAQNCPKSGPLNVYVYREFTRSRDEAGWLNVSWHRWPSAPLSHPGWGTIGGILNPGLPPHTPYLGTPVVFPPGQRPVSFFHQLHLQHHKFYINLQGPIHNGLHTIKWSVTWKPAQTFSLLYKKAVSSLSQLHLSLFTSSTHRVMICL